MDTKTLSKLEFDKVRERLAENAVSEPGKERCRSLLPSSSRYEIERWQKETGEAYTLLLRNGRPPLYGLKDIRDAVRRAQFDAALTMEELLAVAANLETASALREYGKRSGEDEAYPCLDPMFAGLSGLSSLQKEIRRCIASEEEMYDTASQKLHSIRREIRSTQEKVRSHLQGMLHSPLYKTMLQDDVITLRNGRYCVPVKADYKASVQGMIHDQSATGQTVFIEPAAVVQLNNRAAELDLEEKKEIQRILVQLSDQVRLYAQELLMEFELMVQLDFLFAKARLALAMNAVPPVLNERGVIALKNARHPLLDEKTVVPISISLGETFTSLVVTGPNTGGKTVTLKTLGLLQLMGQAGLHIPTDEQPSLAVLDQVFADIGDEQSIEQSLSTFSSHMVNIVAILRDVTPSSLVLLDELGAGTDPVEGAALAASILEELRRRRVLTAATTHYSELKVYALSTDGVENASCEFDVDTLRPTYRLLIGVPGKSNAFAISKRLGLPDSVIQDAERLLKSSDIKFEETIADLERRRKETEEEQRRIRLQRREIDDTERRIREERNKLELQKEKILTKAREEARDILQKAKAEADDSIRIVNKLARQKEVDMRALEAQRSLLRTKAAEAEDKARQKAEEPVFETIDPEKLLPGTRVRLKTMEQDCIVETRPDHRMQLTVQAGIMKIQIRVQDIARILSEDPVSVPKPKRGTKELSAELNSGYGSELNSGHGSEINSGFSAGAFQKTQTIRPEVDLRGMTVDEAMAVLDKYIDDVFLSGISKVTVIHGKGTGTLREACRKYLKSCPFVKSFRLGAYGEGESGVTVVEMKERS